jgi:hypothetical protein
MYPIRFILLIPMVAFGILSGCSSNSPKANIPPTADTQTEISKLEVEMSQAHAANVDVASPRAYKTAHEAFEDAKDLQEKIPSHSVGDFDCLV